MTCDSAGCTEMAKWRCNEKCRDRKHFCEGHAHSSKNLDHFERLIVWEVR